MFLCLSSGSSPRYREDVLRALSMPWGSVLQFRYLKNYVAPGVLEHEKDTGRGESQALIAYIDQSDPSKAPEIVPCRFATITEFTVVGTAVALLLELKDFAFAEDLQKFNSEVRAQSAGTIPAWQPDGKVRGHYWVEVNPDPKTSARSDKLEDWEKIVAQLVGRPDFKDEGCFFTMVGLTDVASRSPVSVGKGLYRLESGHEYELTLYHYYPKSATLRARLSLSTTSRWLGFTTNPVLSLDSRYDLKRVRFKAGKPANDEQAVVSMMRDAGEGKIPYLDFDLLVLIRGVFWRTLGYGIILGLLLAGSQIVATLSNPTLPASRVVIICIASTFIGVLTGIFAAFGLKTSP